MPKAKKVQETDQAKEYLEGWRRAMADLENLKKRTEQEKTEYRKYCLADLLLQILPVLDNFERAIIHVPEADKDSNWLTGILYIHKQLLEVLETNGLTEIEVKHGDQFNPNLAEAIEHTESDEFSSDQIISVEQKGFYLNDKVIRPAKVVVAK